jgi:hypothetical protein
MSIPAPPVGLILSQTFFWEAVMTTIEAFYLAICLAALSVFAIALAYNAWDWRRWKSSQNVGTVVEKQEARELPQTKLAA